MTIKTWRFVTIILAALAMGMKLAHTLELPPKLEWDAELYLCGTSGGVERAADLGHQGNAGLFQRIAVKESSSTRVG